MFIKYSFKGGGVFVLLWICSIISKVTLIAGFGFLSWSHLVLIFEHLEAVINNDNDISFMFILKQLGWIGITFVGAVLIETIVAFGIIIPIGKKMVKKRTRNNFFG